MFVASTCTPTIMGTTIMHGHARLAFSLHDRVHHGVFIHGLARRNLRMVCNAAVDLMQALLGRSGMLHSRDQAYAASRVPLKGFPG